MLTNSCPQRYSPLLLAKCVSNFLLLMFLSSFCTWGQIMKFICLLRSLEGNTEFLKTRAWYEKNPCISTEKGTKENNCLFLLDKSLLMWAYLGWPSYLLPIVKIVMKTQFPPAWTAFFLPLWLQPHKKYLGCFKYI